MVGIIGGEYFELKTLSIRLYYIFINTLLLFNLLGLALAMIEMTYDITESLNLNQRVRSFCLLQVASQEGESTLHKPNEIKNLYEIYFVKFTKARSGYHLSWCQSSEHHVIGLYKFTSHLQKS